MSANPINWAAIANDPRFRRLRARRSRLVAVLMAVSLLYYLLLPIGAACCTGLFATRIGGAFNFGLLLALSQFAVAWGIAVYYTAKARSFDAIAQELIDDAAKVRAR